MCCLLLYDAHGGILQCMLHRRLKPKEDFEGNINASCKETCLSIYLPKAPDHFPDTTADILFLLQAPACFPFWLFLLKHTSGDLSFKSRDTEAFGEEHHILKCALLSGPKNPSNQKQQGKFAPPNILKKIQVSHEYVGIY